MATGTTFTQFGSSNSDALSHLAEAALLMAIGKTTKCSPPHPPSTAVSACYAAPNVLLATSTGKEGNFGNSCRSVVSDDESDDSGSISCSNGTETSADNFIINHSISPTSPSTSISAVQQQSCNNINNSIKRKEVIFPRRLMSILNDPEISKNTIAWLPKGRSFEILNPDAFVEHVLPKIDSLSKGATTKYPSFKRKLNRWGFRQVTTRGGPSDRMHYGSNANGINHIPASTFYHPLFRRDEPELCWTMVCQQKRSSGNKDGNRKREVDSKSTGKNGGGGSIIVNSSSSTGSINGVSLPATKKQKVLQQVFHDRLLKQLVTKAAAAAATSNNNINNNHRSYSVVSLSQSDYDGCNKNSNSTLNTTTNSIIDNNNAWSLSRGSTPTNANGPQTLASNFLKTTDPSAVASALPATIAANKLCDNFARGVTKESETQQKTSRTYQDGNDYSKSLRDYYSALLTLPEQKKDDTDIILNPDDDDRSIRLLIEPALRKNKEENRMKAAKAMLFQSYVNALLHKGV